MVDGDRVDCPLCDKSYRAINRGRGRLKTHAKKVHLPKEPGRVERFRYYDEEGDLKEGKMEWYACPFPDCDYEVWDLRKLWGHFTRYDHFGLLIKKVKMKRRAPPS